MLQLPAQEARDLMDKRHFREAITYLRDNATPCASKAFEEAMSWTVQAMCWTKLRNLDKAAEVLLLSKLSFGGNGN